MMNASAAPQTLSTNPAVFYPVVDMGEDRALGWRQGRRFDPAAGLQAGIWAAAFPRPSAEIACAEGGSDPAPDR